MSTVNKQSCPTCGQSTNQRGITLVSSMVRSLFRVLRWCEDNYRHEFQRKEIKYLFEVDTEICRFADWIHFGSLVYRPRDAGRGHYGLNVARVRDFFAGVLSIPRVVWHDPLTKEYRPEDPAYIHEIPNLSEFLDEHGEYIVRYRNNQGGLF